MAKSIVRHINNSNKLSLWTPSYIPTQGWWDASRTTSITESGGGYISQLDDLSGNGNHMIQPTGALQVLTGIKNINGLNCIYNNDSGTSKPHMYANMTCPNDHMLFIVMNMDVSQFSQGPFSWAGTDVYGGYRYMDEFWGSGNGGSNIVLSENSPDIDVMYSFKLDSSTGDKVAYKNGSNVGEYSDYVSISASSGAQNFRIFRNSDQSCQAWIGECLIVPTDISNETRHKIEGYLAHKWGLQKNLPNNHPYFSFPPRVNDDVIIDLWTPSLMSTEAWYDSSDISTITEAGGLVSQWDDKSGNDNHLKQTVDDTDKPTTGTRTHNLLNVLDFNGTSNWMYTDSNWRTSENSTAIFAVYLNDTPTSGTNEILLQDKNGGGLGRSLVYHNATASPKSLDSFLGNTVTKLFDSTANFEMISFLYDASGNISSFQNGNTQGTGSVTIESNINGNIVVGSNQAGSALFWNGTVGEVIYCSDLTDNIRQKIEGYLAWKWGLVNNLPDNHPHKFEPPRAYVDWTPSSVHTVAWYDASDVSTIIESGGAVSQWNDKSGYGNDVSEGTGSLQPSTGIRTLNDLNVIYFDGTERLRRLDSITSIPTGGKDVYVVGIGYEKVNGSFSLKHNLSPSTNFRFNITPFSGYFIRNDAGTLSNASGNLYDNNPHISSLNYDGDFISTYQDGTIDKGPSDTSANAPLSIDSIGFATNDFWNPSIEVSFAEFIITDHLLDIDRQKMEGYLAWKWGLVSELPSNHPYRSAPPKEQWTPKEISTSAWYDANDSSTITEAGGSVSQWNDKSGNANHLTQATGSNQPTTNSETIGGLNAIRFDQSSFEYFTASNSSSLNFDGNTGFGMFAVLHPLGYNNIGSGVNSFFSKGLALSASQSYSLRTTSGDTIQSHNGVDINPIDDVSITNTDVLVSSDYVKSTTTGRLFVNGTLENTDNVGTGLSDNSDPLYIGRDSNSEPNRCANFRLGEMILVPNVISDDTRQRIEGYLAWKWGLTANLPSGHPYKNKPPTKRD